MINDSYMLAVIRDKVLYIRLQLLYKSKTNVFWPLCALFGRARSPQEALHSTIPYVDYNGA